jgi:hypothetical protein
MENEEHLAKQNEQSASTTTTTKHDFQQVLLFLFLCYLYCYVSESVPSFSLASAKNLSFLSPNWKWGLLFTQKYACGIPRKLETLIFFLLVMN